MLFADEAFHAGDKVAESILKGLITEQTLMYESKGKNPVMGRNCIHIVMASNMDWVVPAGMDNERRFAVFELEDNNRSTQEWNQLYDELNNGGREAMLYELLHRDISAFDPLHVPQTQALAEQKMHGMDSTARWLLEMAENEWHFETDGGGFEEFQPDVFEDAYLVEFVFDSYLYYCKKRNVRIECPSAESFGKSLRKYMPEGFPEHVRRMKNGRRRWYYTWPDAKETVEHIEKMLGKK